MANQIKTFINTTKFPENPSEFLQGIQDLESLLEGPTKFSDILRKYTEDELERAQQKGYIEGYTDAMRSNTAAFIKIKESTEKEIKEYIQKIILISSLVFTYAKSTLPNLTIDQCRAQFNFETNWINIFFIINSKIEDEISFSNMLNFIEIKSKDIDPTHQNSYKYIEMLFVNKHEKDVDYSSIKNDYPFFIKPLDLHLSNV